MTAPLVVAERGRNSREDDDAISVLAHAGPDVIERLKIIYDAR